MLSTYLAYPQDEYSPWPEIVHTFDPKTYKVLFR